jgi:hypothetical protein
MTEELFNRFSQELWNHVASTTITSHEKHEKRFYQFNNMLKQMLSIDKLSEGGA